MMSALPVVLFLLVLFLLVLFLLVVLRLEGLFIAAPPLS